MLDHHDKRLNEWINLSSTYEPPSDIPFTDISGINVMFGLSEQTQPIDILMVFMTNDIVNMMVDETNRYAAQVLDESKPVHVNWVFYEKSAFQKSAINRAKMNRAHCF
jgi:hypothetical protein